MRNAIIALAALAISATAASAADDFKIEEANGNGSFEVAKLKPKVMVFTDYRKDELADPANGLIRFEDWSRSRPVQKSHLSLYPSYVEPTLNVTTNGVTKPHLKRHHMYVATTRFLLSKPAAKIDVARYTTMTFLEGLDPMIKHKALAPADLMPTKNPEYAYARHPQRAWCADAGRAICIQSQYKFEGKLPLGIALANKLKEGKKIPDHLEFQSELRLLSPQDIEKADLPKLTGLNSPVVGAIEHSIIYVNQVMQFGKMLAILQQHPTDPNKTVATAYIALAVDTDLLEKKREYENVPVLRNLVPIQVLMGNSSFNSGKSISSGLPNYTRNQFKAIASILDKE